MTVSYGGREASLAAQAKGEARRIGADGKDIAGDVKEGAEGLMGQAQQKAGELKEKVLK